jgi:eukaryotic-like serine/threonine-protein kinase
VLESAVVAGLIVGVGLYLLVRELDAMEGAALLFGLTVGCGGLLIGLIGGLLSGLLIGLYGGLEVGLSFKGIETRVFPNEGIPRSAWNAVVVGLVGGLVSGPVIMLVFGLVFGLVGGLVSGLFFVPVVGVGVGRQAGGEACFKNVVLRLWLIRNGSTLWNYVKFLDYAADRILLRKVGGGYMFIHRMLLEHFEARYVEPGTTPKKDPSPGEQHPA